MKAGARSLTLLTALIAFGCSAGGEADRAVPVAERATELPDLSAMAPPVAEQLRAQFDRLTKAKADPATPREDLALAYGEMGKLVLAANAYLDAQPYFENARSLAPADARWTYYLAHTHRLVGQSTEAAALFDETVRARPDDVAALVWLGNTYLDQGNPAAAEPPFEKAVAMAPGVAAGHLGLGRVALERRQYAAAVPHLERALALEPGASAVHYPLALAHRALGNVAQAEAQLRQRGSNDLGPPDPLMQEVVDLLRSPVADESRGDKAIAAGDFGAAVRYFRRSLELAPDSVSVRHKLATAQSLTGDVRGALAELQEVLRRSPDFPGAHYSLGVLLLGEGQLDAAIDRFSIAVRGDPTYLPARLQLANALRRRGRFDASQREYADVVARDPRIGEAWFGQAVSLVRLKRFDEARGKLVDALRLFPNQPSLTAVLARVYAAAPDARARDGAAARGLAQQLVARGATVDSAETMAMALAEVGEFEAAAKWQRDAIAAATRAGLGPLAVRMADNLRLYEGRLPCRTPWREEPSWQAAN
jgi:tetratricopeptide (TPR) repeat protein